MQLADEDDEKSTDSFRERSGEAPAISQFEDLVARYDRRIYNLALRLARNPDDAWDVTQETFVRAFKNWDRFEGRSSAYTWLCQIAINLCRNRARDREHWSDEPVDDEALESPGPTPEAALQKAHLSEKIRRAIDSLPGDYRVVSVLRDLQGLTYQEIAEAAGISVDMVKTRLARARAMLRRKLDGTI